MELDASNVNNPDEIGGGTFAEPGQYHVVVQSAFEGDAAVTVEFAILAGTVPGQDGRVHKEYFHKHPKDPAKESAAKFLLNRLMKLAMVLGILKPGEKKWPAWGQAVGQDLVIELENQTYEGKTRPRIGNFGMGMWATDHPDVAQIPKDRAFRGGGGTGGVKAGPPKAVTVPDSGTGTDDWADLT